MVGIAFKRYKIEIKKRHEIVKYSIENDGFFKIIQYQIKQISDLERLISKVATGKINPREVVIVKRFFKSNFAH